MRLFAMILTLVTYGIFSAAAARARERRILARSICRRRRRRGRSNF